LAGSPADRPGLAIADFADGKLDFFVVEDITIRNSSPPHIISATDLLFARRPRLGLSPADVSGLAAIATDLNGTGSDIFVWTRGPDGPRGSGTYRRARFLGDRRRLVEPTPACS
jgi:hypothetical protein